MFADPESPWVEQTYLRPQKEIGIWIKRRPQGMIRHAHRLVIDTYSNCLGGLVEHTCSQNGEAETYPLEGQTPSGFRVGLWSQLLKGSGRMGFIHPAAIIPLVGVRLSSHQRTIGTWLEFYVDLDLGYGTTDSWFWWGWTWSRGASCKKVFYFHFFFASK